MSVPPAYFSSRGLTFRKADYSQPYITPLNAPSHADLPKTLLVTCGFDMLRDVAHAYGLNLSRFVVSGSFPGVMRRSKIVGL